MKFNPQMKKESNEVEGVKGCTDEVASVTGYIINEGVSNTRQEIEAETKIIEEWECHLLHLLP